MPIKSEYINKNVPGLLKEIDFFSTWWNNDCCLVISEINDNTSEKNYYYHTFLLVCEPPFRKVEEKLFCWKVSNHQNLKKNKEENKEIIQILNGEKPFSKLFLFKSNVFGFFGNIFGNSRIIKIEVEDLNSPDDYVRPLDIVWRPISKVSSHVVIYLGNKQVCHISDRDGSNNNNAQDWLEKTLTRNNDRISIPDVLFNYLASSSSSSQDRDWRKLKARIDDWETFLDGKLGKVFCYHPIIPSKNPISIILHLKNALRSEYGEGKYSLISNNCEHFANLIVHGVNYSSQVSSYYRTAVFTVPLAIIEELKIRGGLENRVDEKILDNLENKRKLTNEEKQIFENLEARIEVSFPNIPPFPHFEKCSIN